MRLEWTHYTKDLYGIDTTNFVIPDGYTLYGVAYDRDFPNTCHQSKPILIFEKDGKYYAQCACGENLTTNGKDCGNDALEEFRAVTRYGVTEYNE